MEGNEGRRPTRITPVGGWKSLSVGLLLVVAGCGGGTSTGPTWTFGPMLGAASAAPVASSPTSPTANPSPTPTSAPAATAAPTSQVSPQPIASDGSATPKPFSGRMDPTVLLVDGYVSMYMDLVNTGSEPLTFLNTLYDTEPTRLYSPTVAYPWEAGGTAVITREGRFFPSPAIIQPGHRAVYLMGGMRASGTGVLAAPVANIKFCPTRGMDDIPSIPIQVQDLAWTTSDGVTTVRGTLVETEGSQRADPPVVGVAFFAKDGAFVGAVVNSRVGDRLRPNSSVPFRIEGRGVDASRIDHAEAYAFVS